MYSSYSPLVVGAIVVLWLWLSDDDATLPG